MGGWVCGVVLKICVCWEGRGWGWDCVFFWGVGAGGWEVNVKVARLGRFRVCMDGNSGMVKG